MPRGWRAGAGAALGDAPELGAGDDAGAVPLGAVGGAMGLLLQMHRFRDGQRQCDGSWMPWMGVAGVAGAVAAGGVGVMMGKGTLLRCGQRYFRLAALNVNQCVEAVLNSFFIIVNILQTL